MNRRLLNFLAAIVTCLFLACPALTTTVNAQTPDSVVHAVLFYSPNCSHCQDVIQNYLPPLFEEFGDRLEIVGIDVTQPEGMALYQSAIERFQIPPERLGVPTLVVGDVILVGSGEIPERFPGLIEQSLAEGGVDWPDIPGLWEALATPTLVIATQGITAATATATQEAPASAPTTMPGLSIAEGHAATWQEKFARDPVGNTLSVAVLAGMLAALSWAVLVLLRASTGAAARQISWSVPILSLAGLVVAGYLAYVETTSTTAVCGPVGDCNTVQQSQYARLFGILPIGVIGLVGYVLIALAWIVTRVGREVEVAYGTLALLGMTMTGTLFSIYLTFLEPFVIGATCAWCLTSSVLMTILMLLSVPPGAQAMINLKRAEDG